VLPSNLPPAPSLARLLAELPSPAVRVVCTGGVTLQRVDGAWGVAAARERARDESPLLTSAMRALGLRTTPPNAAPAVRPPDAGLSGAAWGLPPESEPPIVPTPAPTSGAGHAWQPVDPDALAREAGVRAVVLLTDAADPTGEGGHLVSAAGTLAWRPPLQQLGDLPSLGAHALRLRFAVDAAEQRAVAAAMRYARAADAARQAAALLDASELTTLAVAPALFVELDALFAAASETLEGVTRLVEDAFGGSRARRTAPTARERSPQGRRAALDARLLRARGTPPEVRDLLLAVWDAHGALAAGHRRAIRRAAAAELGPPTVRVHRLAEGPWSVALPIGAESGGRDAGGAGRRGRQDAFALGWTFATETWRAATLAIYAVTSER
jgi:hypothetical protein